MTGARWRQRSVRATGDRAAATGRADADQPTQASSPIGFDDGFVGAGERSRMSALQRLRVLRALFRLVLLPTEDPQRPEPRTTTRVAGDQQTPTVDSFSLLAGGGHADCPCNPPRQGAARSSCPARAPLHLRAMPAVLHWCSCLSWPAVEAGAAEAAGAGVPVAGVARRSDGSAVVSLPARPPDDRRERAPAAGTVDPRP